MKPSATSGDSLSPFLLITLSFLITSADFTITTAAEAIMEHEVDGAIDALRVNNYSLFSNAIATSDLRFHLLTGDHTSFTLLSPHNSDLFRLGMSSTTAADFVQTLRYHVLLRRLSAADLRHLSGSTRTQSLLLPHHGGPLLANRETIVNGTVSKYFAADRVRISSPNLYLGPNIAVHGLDGILTPKIGSAKDLACDLGIRKIEECEWHVSTPESIQLEKENLEEEVLGHESRKMDGVQESNHRGFLKYNHDIPL